ncbi:MAG: site-2 protease family protein [Anaerolineae bacterium]|nr:site-2 protease family protein [Anaerolineae bacterium]
MSLYELPPATPEPTPPFAASESDPQMIALQEAVRAVMAVEITDQIASGDHSGLLFRGQLVLPATEAALYLEERLTPLGYSAFLQREGEVDTVLVVPGIADADQAAPGGGPLRRAVRASGRSPLWLHIALLLATIASTVYAASFLLNGADLGLAEALAAGGPFALTLLFILGVHEMGHYLAARRHGVKVTLPFFIPLPIPGSLGTMGAVIFIRSALKTRRALFDVGISGPLAGLVVALPMFVIGLLLPPITFGAPINLIFRGVGVPPLLEALGAPLVESSLSRAILLHPVALAAWFGVLLTALNLLPLGQFDGGHVAYALFGRRAWPLAYLVLGMLALAGIFFWPTWLVWAVLASLTGLRHPPPHDDITPLDIRRRILGWLTILIFLLIVVPRPIISRQVLTVNPNASPIPTLVVPNIPTPTPFDPGAYK